MALNPLDFITGIDFTGMAVIQGNDLNNGIAATTPLKDADETVGRGLNIVTTDSAANVPVVPDPTINVSYTKFKRYKWQRRPFAGSVDKSCRNYSWNDDLAISNPTTLKWILDTVDLTTVTNNANNALATADNAVAIAGVANATSNTAVANIATAVATANAANAAAVAAGVTAGNALTVAGTANTTANNAAAQAANAVTAINTPGLITNKLSPSAIAYQLIRTKGDLTKVEWFSRSDCYMKITEIYTKGTDNPTVPGIGKNTRIMNFVDNNSGGYISLAGGIVTVLVAGTYRIRGYAIVNRSGASVANAQCIIADNVTNTTLLTGSSIALANGNTNNVVCDIDGLITFALNQTMRLDLYTSTATGIVFGKAANVHPDAGGHEVYAGIEFEFLGV